MKKRNFAILLAAVTAATMAGTTALYYAKDDVRLSLSGRQVIEELSEGDEDSENLITEEEKDTGNAALPADNPVDDLSMAELAAAELPTGNIQKADLTDVTKEEAIYSGVSDVVEKTMPTLVSITATSLQNVEDWFRGRVYQRTLSSAGSGVILGENDDELLIATNCHVVEGASELTVTFIDEESVSAVIKGTDSKNDLAVIAVSLDDIKKSTKKQIRVANVVDSKDVLVGQQVVAIGNALGYGQSVTTGIISALNREINVQDGYSILTFGDLIQTDAAINRGNSGGALLNMRGELIGINCAKAGMGDVEDMGYAIPTSKALPIIEKLMKRETREKADDEDAAYIGISGQDMTFEVVQLYGLPSGVYITSVESGAPAEEAGLEEGMILTGFEDYDIESMQDLQEALSYYKGGEEVTITAAVQSENGGYEEEDFELTLGYRSDYMHYVR